MAELERTAGEVVASAPQRHLWEWDYTLWVCMRIAEKLTQRGEERSHERLLNNHGVNVSALRKALKHWPELMALLDGPLRPRRKPDGTPKRQNEITTDIQLFRDRITQIPATAPPAGTPYKYFRPFKGMAVVDALVEIKVPVGTAYRRIKCAKDVAKLAVSGEYYRQAHQQDYPYLAAWIFDIDNHAAAEPKFFPRRFVSLPDSTRRVRVLLFHPNGTYDVIRPGAVP